MTLRIALAVFVAVVIIIAAFAFFTPHANRGGEQAPSASIVQKPVPDVSLSDSYKKGMHTISGSIMAPTPCTSVTADASVASGTPAVISVTISMPSDAGICLQQATVVPFKVSAAAGADAIIAAYVNGAPASTTVKTL
jgi:hypothetical protein